MMDDDKTQEISLVRNSLTKYDLKKSWEWGVFQQAEASQILYKDLVDPLTPLCTEETLVEFFLSFPGTINNNSSGNQKDRHLNRPNPLSQVSFPARCSFMWPC